ncbi:MAG: serine hydrolase, partial [Thermoanaerobaculia bacterium]|nr:serine hydrolase [Thermoanaerobaculia bacterium]
ALDDGWPTATAAEAGLDEGPLVALMQAVLAGDYPQVHSILVARGGRLAVEEYFYGYGRERLHTLQSCTKSVTSLLFGIALEEGLLKDLDAPVHGFFPGYAGRRWVDAAYDISLRHALTMSASLAWNESLPYTDPRNDNTAMNASADWIGYVLDRERAGAPGQKFAYTSGLSILLGGVLRQATGRYADEYAAETLFPALGIDSYRWFAAPDGTRHTGGGLSLRPRDFLKIGQLVLDGGAWNGRQVVPAAWIAESTSRQTGEGDTPYGYQWWLGSFDAGGEAVEAIQALGYGGQILSIFPSLDLVVAFTAGDYAGDGARPRERLERYILPAASSSPRQKPR